MSVRVVHLCATFGVGVVRRARHIRAALTQAITERGAEVTTYGIVTAPSQAALAYDPGVDVLPLLPERDAAIVLQRQWDVKRYVAEFNVYCEQLRDLLRRNDELFEAEVIVSDQIPEVFERPLPGRSTALFVNDYFAELDCLGPEHAYIDTILESSAQVLFADTPLLLERTQQKAIASRFGGRFHQAGPILDFGVAEHTTGEARRSLEIAPEAFVLYVAHPRTPNAAAVMSSLQPDHVLADDAQTLAWAAQFVKSAATLASYAAGLGSADVVLGKGGRVTTYEAIQSHAAVVADPFPGNEKEDVFVRTLAEQGVVIDARNQTVSRRAIAEVRERLGAFRAQNFDPSQLQRAFDEALAAASRSA